MTGEPTEFDMSAAWLRRAHGDMNAFMEGLAARLDGALPGRVAVERKRRGLFSKETHVVAVSVDFDASQFRLIHDRGTLVATRAKIVRGVTISSAELKVPAWLEALNHDIQVLGEQAGAAHSVLHDFLMS